MLSRNVPGLEISPIAVSPAAAGRARRAHVAHGLVVGFHALCCGSPILMALLGAMTGVGAMATAATAFHHLLHGYEWWVVGLSALFVGFGAVLEWRQRSVSGGRVSILFLASCFALAANVVIVLSHAGVPHGS